MNTKLKKFLSFTLTAAALAGFNVPAVHAAISVSSMWKNLDTPDTTANGLPWTNNLNNPNPGEKSNAGLNPTLGNWDCYFSGGNAYGEPVDDGNGGKALRFTYTGATGTEGFVAWAMPTDLTSGKLLYQFDFKMLGTTAVPLSVMPDETDWQSVISIEKNQVNVSGGVQSSIGTYRLNEWNTVKLLFDIDNKEVTVYYNGNSTTTAKTYHRCMKFVLWPNADICIDNLHAELIDTNQGITAEYSTDGNTIGKYIDVNAENITVEVPSSEFMSLPEITLTSLGEDIISSADDTVLDITPEIADSKINIALNDYLDEGTTYKLNIGDAKDMFGRSISNNEIIFTAAENNGYKQGASKSEDFSTGDKGDFFQVADGTFGIVDGSEYTGGHALQFTSQAAVGLSGTERQHKGKLHLVMNMTFPTAAKWGYDTEDNGDFIELAHGQWYNNAHTIDFMYETIYEGKTVWWDNWLPRKDGINKIDYTIDFDTKQSTYSLNDGQSYTMNIPLRSAASIGNLEQGIRLFRFLSPSSVGDNGSMTIDTFSWTQEYLPATVDKIAFVGADGNELTYDEATGIDLDAQIKLYFSDAVNEETLANITVKKGDIAEEFDGVYDSDDNSYTISLADGFAQDSTYSLNIPTTVKDTSGFDVTSAYGTFKTGKAEFAVSSIEITDENGNAIENLAAYEGTTVKVKATVKNTYPMAKTAAIVLAGYNGTVLKNADYKTVSIESGATSAEETFTLKDKTDLTKVRAFALSDMETLTPYCPAAEIK